MSTPEPAMLPNLAAQQVIAAVLEGLGYDEEAAADVICGVVPALHRDGLLRESTPEPVDAYAEMRRADLPTTATGLAAVVQAEQSKRIADAVEAIRDEIMQVIIAIGTDPTETLVALRSEVMRVAEGCEDHDSAAELRAAVEASRG